MINNRPPYIANNAKALTLRELYIRQIGNIFSAYKSIMFGGQKRQSIPKCSNQASHECSRCDYSCTDRQNSRDDNVDQEMGNYPKQSCLRKVSSLPATQYTPAFIGKDDTQKKDAQMRKNRVSYDSMLNDKDDLDYRQTKGQHTHERKQSTKSKSIGSRLSLIFSIEDMTTDSTSILKDARHPSVLTISGNQPRLTKNIGTIYLLNCFCFENFNKMSINTF